VPVASEAVQGSTRRFYFWLGLITLLALAVRLFYALHTEWNQHIWGDAFMYHYTANGIADGFGFQTWLPANILQPTRHIVALGPSADHGPLYPLYLAGFTIVGLRSFHAHMIASVLLGTASVFVVGLAARKVAGPRVGLVAAAIAAVYANFWVNDALVMSETMAIFLAAVLVLLAYRMWEQPSLSRVIAFGAVCGFAALARVEMLFLTPLVLVPFVVRRLGDRSWRQRLGVLAVAGAAAVLVMSPWVIRNMTTWKHPELLATGGGLSLMSGSCDAAYSGDVLGWWSPRCVSSMPLPKGDASEQDQVWRNRALDYIGSHLDRLPVVALARVGRMWELYRPGSPWGDVHRDQKLALDQVEGRTEKAARLALAQFYLLAPLAIAGAIVLWRRRVTIAPLVALPITSTIMAVTAFGNTRYRAISEVAIVIFAAVAVDALVRRQIARRRPPVPAAPDPPVARDELSEVAAPA